MIILVGASASGKTEAAKKLKVFGIEKVITTTTRQPRVGEVNGIDYFFVDKDEFLSRLNENKFIEHTTYCNNFYGTGKDQVGFNKVLVVEPDGLKSFKELNDSSIITFFLDATEETRRKRMIGRGDDAYNVEGRLKTDREKFDKSNICSTDFIIKTDDKSIEEISSEIYSLYQEELKRRGIN